jgi:hypothetical protein
VTIYSKKERSDGDSASMPAMPGMLDIVGLFGKIILGGGAFPDEAEIFKGMKPGGQQGGLPRDKLAPPPAPRPAAPRVPELPDFDRNNNDDDDDDGDQGAERLWFVRPSPKGNGKGNGSEPEGECSGPSSDL